MKNIYSHGKTFTDKQLKTIDNKKKNNEAFTVLEDFAKETKIMGTETPQELVKKLCLPPLGGEQICEEFEKYGYTLSVSAYDGWEWREDKLTDITESEAWKMIALSSTYWGNFYKNLYYKRETK